MKRNLKFGLLLALLCFGIAVTLISFSHESAWAAAKKSYRVGIFQIARHPVLDTIPEGFREALDARLPGKVKYETLIAEGDPGKIEQMATMFVTKKFDLVFVIGTNCAQSLAKKTNTLPIVLGAATDPKAAGLVDSWEKPGRNITGTSDLSPVDVQLDRLRELIPKASRIGVIFNPSEENSQAIVSRFKAECQNRGLEPVLTTISSQNEMRQTVVSLLGKIDALYAPTDATVQTAFDVLVKTAGELRIPVFNCDEGTVQKGALFSVGFNYRDIGYTSGEMAAEILLGNARPEEMPIQLVGRRTLYFNPKEIEQFGLTVPPDWNGIGKKVGG